jgi:pyruvate,water dikinase
MLSVVSHAANCDNAELSPFNGVQIIEGRTEFDRLSSGSDFPGALQLSEVKFLITDIRTDNPEIYFINSGAFEYHWTFYNEALGWNMDLMTFNTRTYSDFNRLIIAGSVVANDRYVSPDSLSGIYTVEFWPSDPIHAEEAELALRLIRAGMPFSESRLVYHPAGETQVNIYLEERELFDSLGVPAVFTADLYKGVDYAALNTGEACGILTDGGAGGTLSAGDIVVFQSIPNDISHVAGIITTVPQTPLSHINLKARQNGTPNVYIPGFAESDEFRTLLGRCVRLTALPGGYTINEIEFSEAVEWLESVRPDTVTVLGRDLTQTAILNLDYLRLDDSGAYGAKAVNLGELTWCLPSFSVPYGCAIPFYYYCKFMEYNNLYTEIDSLVKSENFNSSSEFREEVLRNIRQKIRDGEIPPWMMDSLSVIACQFEPGIALRCRSSTNNEDLPGFNGAGLYSSYTFHPDEGNISETLKQVWAGIWTYRAFEEREFHRIDHFSAAMGIIIHPSYKDEAVNGVAVTRNIFNPFITGFYVNVQAGDDMVTNPETESVPEEFIITEQNVTGVVTREIQYIGFSNRASQGGRILSDNYIDQLAEYLGMIHNHFAEVYGVNRDDAEFAMEIEFKVTAEGDLVVKQARPWVSGN